MSSQNDKLHSFYFKETVDGVEHDYRITENNGTFGVEKDGCILAEIESNYHWEQTGGDPLSDELFKKICDRIEDHYE